MINKSFTILSLSYNNSKWYKRNLDSIFNQNYDNYNILYVDDCSSDNTYSLVKHYAQTNQQQHRIKLIKNNVRQGALANRFFYSRLIADDSIIMIVDGDDWLANNNVLEKINNIYSNEDIWITYGQFRRFPLGEKGHCKKLSSNYRLRETSEWPISHLRTYYSWLFKLIRKKDLLYQGNFFNVAEDVATMIPMLEMAKGHIKFIPEILYIYNQQTPLNDFKLKGKEQSEITNYIKSLPAYQHLDKNI